MVLLLSGGIDSPVAGYLMGRQGAEIVALSGLVTSSDEGRFLSKITKHVENLSRLLEQPIPLYFFEHRIALDKFASCCKKGLTCVLCKRTMLRIAEQLCKDIDAKAIIMGDSLGQVASQTLQNISVIEEAVDLPIIRPLIGFDKTEITRLAEQMGSFEISNIKTTPCEFVPEYPSTKAFLEDVKREEEKIEIDKLRNRLVTTLRVIDMTREHGGEVH